MEHDIACEGADAIIGLRTFDFDAGSWTICTKRCVRVLNCKAKTIKRCNARDSHIQVPVVEHRLRQVHSNHIESLALGFVDCHCECNAHRELQPRPLKWEDTLVW